MTTASALLNDRLRSSPLRHLLRVFFAPIATCSPRLPRRNRLWDTFTKKRQCRPDCAPVRPLLLDQAMFPPTSSTRVQLKPVYDSAYVLYRGMREALLPAWKLNARMTEGG